MKVGQAASSGHPEAVLAILIESLDKISLETVFASELVIVISVNAIDALAGCA